MTSSLNAHAEESTPAAEADAAALFREAEARYVAGDIAGALESMQRAYDVSSRAELLYNLGELRRELGQCREARRDYEAYLERVATGARRERALEALDGLRAQCPEEQAALPPPSPSPPPPQSPSPPESKTTSPSALALTTPSSPVPPESTSMRPMTIAGWSAIGAGVLSGGFATYFAVDATNQANRLEQRIKSVQANPDNRPLSGTEKAIETRGERSAVWGRVLGIGAVGFAAIGVSLLVFGRDTSEPNHAGLSFEGRGDGAAAAYGHSF